MFADKSPAEMQGIVQEFGAWMQNLDKDALVSADKLVVDMPGRVLRTNFNGVEVWQGYHNETEVLGGTLSIKAKDCEEVCKILENHPHLKYQGVIEVREVDQV